MTRRSKKRLRANPAGRPVVNGLPVPWVARWSGEKPAPSAEFVRETLQSPDGSLSFRIRYADEKPADRDQFGILWYRAPAQSLGHPEFSQVHPHRQRDAMDLPRCQVCAKPLRAAGAVWMLAPSEIDAKGTGEAMTGQPPLCPPCVELSSTYCPHLRSGARAPYRAERHESVGVFADVHRPDLSEPTYGDLLGHDDFWIGCALARQRVVKLHDITPLDARGRAAA